MLEHQNIYLYDAGSYDRLVSREDYQGHILKTLQDNFPFRDADIIELGAGTGRLTRLLTPLARSIYAFDQSQAMLDVANDRLRLAGLKNWQTGVADYRQIPLPDGSADLVVSGWSVCYVVVWNGECWQIELEKTLKEIRRLLRPGGWIILLETLGTGLEVPEAPPHLLAYYKYLEACGFQRTWIRTDYFFTDLQQAERLSAFFFGEEMASKFITDEHGVILPECTGIWWLHTPGVNP